MLRIPAMNAQDGLRLRGEGLRNGRGVVQGVAVFFRSKLRKLAQALLASWLTPHVPPFGPAIAADRVFANAEGT
jgi:hypothetical protein